MSARARNGFARDRGGVSEVLSFVLTLGISFLFIVMSMVLYGVMAQRAQAAGAQAQAEELANRVALSVQEAMEVARARTDATRVSSDLIRFQRVLEVPTRFHGLEYSVNLDPRYVNVTLVASGTVRGATTLASNQLLPSSPAACTSSFVLCELTGTVRGGSGRITITYLYDASASPVVNQIKIA